MKKSPTVAVRRGLSVMTLASVRCTSDHVQLFTTKWGYYHVHLLKMSVGHRFISGRVLQLDHSLVRLLLSAASGVYDDQQKSRELELGLGWCVTRYANFRFYGCPVTYADGETEIAP